MDDARYSMAVKQVFHRLLKAIDGADPDLVEADATGDLVTVSSPGSAQKVIMNTQRAVQQLWVAGNGVGVHFSLGADGRWLDDRGQGIELLAWMRDCVRNATGVSLDLEPPSA